MLDKLDSRLNSKHILSEVIHRLGKKLREIIQVFQNVIISIFTFV